MVLALKAGRHATGVGGTWRIECSLQAIEEVTGLSRPNVCRALKRLEETGVIEREAGGGRGKPTTYVLNLKTVSSKTPLFSGLNT